MPQVEPGETPEAALSRELHEELRIRVDPTALVPLTFASHTYDTFHLLMPLFGMSLPPVNARSHPHQVMGKDGR